MDDLDRQLLLFLQNGIPLRKRPFEGIAVRLGLDRADVLLRISRLKFKKIIRQITAVLDGTRLGYESSSAAMMVPRENLENAVAWMNTHPGVIHCVSREDGFNLWFSLALPVGMMEKQLRRLHTFTGARKTILLPPLKRFKGPGAGESGELNKHVAPVFLNSGETELIRRIQEDFPIDDEPFRKLAEDAGIPETELFEILTEWTKKAYLKKITALRPSGTIKIKKTFLSVWEVPEERQDEAGCRIAEFPEVTECVKRTAYPEFPFALHAGVAASDKQAAEEILGRISERVGHWPCRLLPDVKEYKKVRVKYFSEGLEDWQCRVPEVLPKGHSKDAT